MLKYLIAATILAGLLSFSQLWVTVSLVACVAAFYLGVSEADRNLDVAADLHLTLSRAEREEAGR